MGWGRGGVVVIKVNCNPYKSLELHSIVLQLQQLHGHSFHFCILKEAEVNPAKEL